MEDMLSSVLETGEEGRMAAEAVDRSLMGYTNL